MFDLGWKWSKSKWFILLDPRWIIHYGNFIGVLWIHTSRSRKYRCFDQLSTRAIGLVPLLWRRNGYRNLNFAWDFMDELQFRKLKLHVYHCYPKQAEEKTVGGNYGLNDQLQALTFINQNKEKTMRNILPYDWGCENMMTHPVHMLFFSCSSK